MENKERFRRVFVIVIDSLGVGGAMDAALEMQGQTPWDILLLM